MSNREVTSLYITAVVCFLAIVAIGLGVWCAVLSKRREEREEADSNLLHLAGN